MRILTLAILAVGLLFVSQPLNAEQQKQLTAEQQKQMSEAQSQMSAEQRKRSLQRFDALRQSAQICNETKRCDGAVESVKLKIFGEEVDGVKVTTPTGSTTFFKRVLWEGFCFCQDCVSVPPDVWCTVW